MRFDGGDTYERVHVKPAEGSAHLSKSQVPLGKEGLEGHGYQDGRNRCRGSWKESRRIEPTDRADCAYGCRCDAQKLAAQLRESPQKLDGMCAKCHIGDETR